MKISITPIRKSRRKAERKYVKIAERNGIHYQLYSNRRSNGWSKERASTEPKRRRNANTGEVAIYRGDDLLVVGTAKECADELGVTLQYIQALTTPSRVKTQENRKDSHNATIAIKLDVED